MSNHKIIFLNGPPRCGKDEAGKAITHTFTLARTFKMSGGMKRALPELLNFSHENARYAEKTKEAPIPWLNDMSWRQLQISMSEDWLKPVFGKDIFGRLAVRYLQRATMYTTTAITDCGFRAEAEPIVNWAGRKNCLLIQISRDGCDFLKDSRSYIELDDLGVTTVQVRNNYPELEYWHTKICMVVGQWLSAQQS